jgi:PKD repeat protein
MNRRSFESSAMHTRTRFHRVAGVAALAALVASGACTLKDQEPPPLTGPSETGVSVLMSATPDVITQDGASQSVVQITVSNAAGEPMRNLTLRLQIAVNNVISDFGRLSETTLVTDGSGRATVVYTAPPAPPDFNDGEPIIQIVATPVGQNYGNAISQWVNIRLVRPGTVYEPGAPIANFSYSPSAPVIGQLVEFDGSFSEDPDGRIVDWEWNWDDGEVEFGVTQDHDFFVARDHLVTLTVTDNSGKRSSLTRTIRVR